MKNTEKLLFTFFKASSWSLLFCPNNVPTEPPVSCKDGQYASSARLPKERQPNALILKTPECVDVFFRKNIVSQAIIVAHPGFGHSSTSQIVCFLPCLGLHSAYNNPAPSLGRLVHQKVSRVDISTRETREEEPRIFGVGCTCTCS